MINEKALSREATKEEIEKCRAAGSVHIKPGETKILTEHLFCNGMLIEGTLQLNLHNVTSLGAVTGDGPVFISKDSGGCGGAIKVYVETNGGSMRWLNAVIND